LDLDPPLAELASPPRAQRQPAAAWIPLPSPRLGVVLQAAAGFLLLGLAGSAGRASVQASLVLPLVVLGLAVLPGIIGAPALLVLHQYQGRAATPAGLLRALCEAWMEAGRLAGGLAAVVLFFALTSMMGTKLLFGALALAGWLGLSAARRRLRQVEHAAGGGRGAFGLLLWAWTLLTALVGARLTWMAVLWLRHFA